MQREGRLKYAFTIGKYRAPNDYDDEPVLGQATLLYGLPYDMTVYGGLQTAKNYTALAAGMGFGMGELGSISVDATQAYTSLDAGYNIGKKSKNGQSYRFQYSKDIHTTDSTVTLAGYRYSTKGFYTFSEAMDARAFDEFDEVENFIIHNNKRSKIQVDLTQNLMGGNWGSLSFSGYQQDYWNEEGYERNASASYSNSWNDISLTLMYTYTEYPNTQTDNNQQLALNVSIPLSRWLPNSYANTSMTTDMHGRTNNQIGLSGTALADNNLSYSIGQGYGNRGQNYSGRLNADYRGTYGEVSGGYNYSGNTQQVNYGLQGTVIAHPYGVTLGQSLSGDMTSVALVSAPGVEGGKVQNGTGVRTDWRGYTVVPYLSPYKRSRVALDPASLGDNVDLMENVKNVVPTAGAVVLANFKTNVGNRVLVTLSQAGRAIPFGATVSMEGDTDNVSIVGEEGQVYLSGLPQSGNLVAKWNNGGAQQCRASFMLPTAASGKDNVVGVQQISANCVGGV